MDIIRICYRYHYVKVIHIICPLQISYASVTDTQASIRYYMHLLQISHASVTDITCNYYRLHASLFQVSYGSVTDIRYHMHLLETSFVSITGIICIYYSYYFVLQLLYCVNSNRQVLSDKSYCYTKSFNMRYYQELRNTVITRNYAIQLLILINLSGVR